MGKLLYIILILTFTGCYKSKTNDNLSGNIHGVMKTDCRNMCLERGYPGYELRTKKPFVGLGKYYIVKDCYCTNATVAILNIELHELYYETE